MVVVIPRNVGYREAVRTLSDTLRPWGMYCRTRDSLDRSEVIVESRSGEEVDLTPKQKKRLLEALPKGSSLGYRFDKVTAERWAGCMLLAVEEWLTSNGHSDLVPFLENAGVNPVPEEKRFMLYVSMNNPRTRGEWGISFHVKLESPR